MNVHKFKHDPQVLLEEGKRIAAETSDPKYAARIRHVNVLLQGKLGTRELSEATGIPRRTLQHWLKSADEHGWESLQDEPRKGGPKPRLSPEQIEEIRQVVLDDPRKQGYQVWTGSSVAEYIRKTCKIEYCVSSAQKLLKRMGLTLLRPTTVPSTRPSEEEIDEFVKKTDACDEQP